MKNISFNEFQEKISSLSVAHKVLLFLGTLAFMAAAFYFLKFETQLNTLNTLTKQISQQQIKLASLKAAASKVEVLKKELAQSEEELTKLLMLLPDQKEIPGLLENVSRLGAKVGLENILFQPQREITQEFYAIIPIKLDLLGTFNDLGVFLDSISKLNRILKIETLTITRPKDKQAQLLQVGCTIVTYRFIENPEPSDAKKPGAKKPAPKKK